MNLEIQNIIEYIHDIRKAIFVAEPKVKSPEAKGLKRKLVALTDRMEICARILDHELDKDNGKDESD